MELPDNMVDAVTGSATGPTCMPLPSTTLCCEVTKDSTVEPSSPDDRFRFCDSLDTGAAEARFLVTAIFGAAPGLAGAKTIGAQYGCSVWESGVTTGLFDAYVFWVGFATIALGWFRYRWALGITGYGMFVVEDCVKSVEEGLPITGAVMLSFLDCCAKVPSQRVPEGCIGAKVMGALEGSIGAGVAWGAGGLVKEVLRAFRMDCLSAGTFCTDECIEAVASP